MNRFALMETFVAVYEAGSFSAAAQRLQVGQPAVSKAIANLESHLKVPLVLRSTRGLTPTEAGERFYEHARRALDEAEEAESAARDDRQRLAGRVRLCAGVTFARLHVIPHLPELMSLHPELAVDVVLHDANIDLIENGIDVALRIGDLADSTLTARRITQTARRVLATPAFFARHGRPEHPSDLETIAGILHTVTGQPPTWTFARGDERVTTPLVGRFQTNAAEGVRAGVLAGLGMAVIPEWVFDRELADGTVVTALDDWSLPAVHLWAVFPAGRSINRRTRAVVDFLAEKLDRPERETSANAGERRKD